MNASPGDFFIITIGTSILPRRTPPPRQALDEWDKDQLLGQGQLRGLVRNTDSAPVPTGRNSPEVQGAGVLTETSRRREAFTPDLRGKAGSPREGDSDVPPPRPPLHPTQPRPPAASMGLAPPTG